MMLDDSRSPSPTAAPTFPRRCSTASLGSVDLVASMSLNLTLLAIVAVLVGQFYVNRRLAAPRPRVQEDTGVRPVDLVEEPR